MTEEKPVLTKTEVRQGNSRMLNFRVLIYGLVLIVIAFAAILWFMSATYDETATTTDGGERLEDTQTPAPEGEQLDDAPMPAMPDETLVEPGSPAPGN